MTNQIGNYGKHAHIWDWGGYDRTKEHEFWCSYAKKFGKHALIPFCAIGEAGAYMAQNGLSVTAFDITHEMIEESKKRFGNIEGLQFFVGDVRDFRFDIPPADFCFSSDFGHIHSMEDVKKALSCINRHLRAGGALVIETALPYRESKYSPPETFYPREQVYPDKKVWKIGQTRIDAETGRCHFSQTVYIEDMNGCVEQFDHILFMQSYPRDAWLSALSETGFEVLNEYGNREKEPWSDNNGYWLVEAIKKVGFENE